ncbi:WAT1-related protein At2g39510-like [Ipomoea triloba]|uniref:WAT1-related protein At2g39510-like n=1 Tax=Ipomoea triloba TaxID=35885 RepID=UPI00125E9159|nr:WAT1-related protein At2g39510-like [Ipomoea triloba]
MVRRHNMTRENLVKFLKLVKPYLGVILLQFGSAGMSIIAKSALNDGMSPFTYAVYRSFFAAAFMAPFALAFERKIWPKMTVPIFLKIMVLALLEPVVDINLNYIGLKYTTATFTKALSNLVPAITFILAWILRLEKVKMRKLHSQAKILGIIATFGGAMIMTLVKGPNIGLPWTKHTHHIHTQTLHSQQDFIKGALMIAAGCICWASFYILQANTLKSYPAGLSLTCLICTMGALQASVVALVAERGNPAAWALHWDIKLLAYVYSGVIGSGVTYYLSGVIIKEKGPVFVTAFNPLNMIIVAILGSFMLAEQLDFGKALGAGVIIIGLYMVLWGKKQDQDSLELINDKIAPADKSPSTLVKFPTKQEPIDTPKTIAGDDEVV